jgi:ribonuclease P protein component
MQIGMAKLKPGGMLRLGVEFRHLREHGQKHAGRHLVLITAPSEDGTLRCGIICGKRYSKKAVERNRARRLLKESFRLLGNGIAPIHLGLIPRQSLKGQAVHAVQRDLIRLLAQAGHWRGEGDSP